MNFILGTAEFNPEGYAGKPCPSTREIIHILNLAWEGGIRILDCADAYNCTETIQKYGGGFTNIWKSRDKALNCFYHYKQDEAPIDGVSQASVYTLEQSQKLTSIIVPVNINNVGFILEDNVSVPGKVFFRSVFDRGRLLKQGYSVKDCLSFVKRHPNDGIIVGVNSVKELEQILKAV